MGNRDPIEAHADDSRDLYDVSTWEPRSSLDGLSVRLYRGILTTLRAIVILLAVLILLSQFLLGSIGATFAQDPYSVGLVVLSVAPAVGLAAYVYFSDITSSEPLELIVGTFMLGILFAGFAAVLNTVLGPIVRGVPAAFGVLGAVVGSLLFFYLVVGPVEESVKLLAVRLYPYRDESFDAVIDGAVYGAAAGLGFATIENALYITRNIGAAGTEMALGTALTTAGLGWVAAGLADLSIPVVQSGASGIIGIFESGGRITALRALAGPGHVIYSAFAGYYLGLAKFNGEHAGPIVVKGLIIASLIHGTYNVMVGFVPAVFSIAASQFLGVAVPDLVAFFAFVVIYDGIFGFILFRKIARYRTLYREVRGRSDREEAFPPEATEFDP